MKNQSHNNKPCYTIFLGEGGYPNEREKALATFEVGKQYTVIGGTIGRSRSNIIIEGFEGEWNSVLFDVDIFKAPLEESYMRRTLEEMKSSGEYHSPIKDDGVSVVSRISQLNEIRDIIIRTGLTENEGSLIGMVQSIADLAVQRCKDLDEAHITIARLNVLLDGSNVLCNKIGEIVGEKPWHRDLIEAVEMKIHDLNDPEANRRRKILEDFERKITAGI